jgi:hypothetical protein
MTNREWLNSLPDNEFVDVCGFYCLCSYIQDYYSNFCKKNDTCFDCVDKWLATEHTEPKEGD